MTDKFMYLWSKNHLDF